MLPRPFDFEPPRPELLLDDLLEELAFLRPPVLEPLLPFELLELELPRFVPRLAGIPFSSHWQSVSNLLQVIPAEQTGQTGR